MLTLRALVLFVTSSGLLGARELRDLGDRDIPPRLAVWRRDQRIRLDVDHRCPHGVLGSDDSIAELVDSVSTDHIGTQACRVGGEVDRQPVAIEAGRGAVTVFGAESLRTQRLRQGADRCETVVLDQHHYDLDAFLNGRHEFGVHHQIGSVTDQDEDIAVVLAVQPGGVEHRHLDAQPACDLIAHTGKPVFDVIALAVAGPPQLVQVSGHRTGGTYDYIARV